AERESSILVLLYLYESVEAPRFGFEFQAVFLVVGCLVGCGVEPLYLQLDLHTCSWCLSKFAVLVSRCLCPRPCTLWKHPGPPGCPTRQAMPAYALATCCRPGPGSLRG